MNLLTGASLLALAKSIYYKFALLDIARNYKAPTLFADLQGPICYKDSQNKGINLIVY